MIYNLKETVESPRAWSHSPRVPQVGEEGAEACLWTVRNIFPHYPGALSSSSPSDPCAHTGNVDRTNRPREGQAHGEETHIS